MMEQGWLRWGMDRVGEQQKRYLDRGNHYGVREKPGAREIPRTPQEPHQLRLLPTVERVNELTFPYIQISDYSNCHYRTYIQ